MNTQSPLKPKNFQLSELSN